MTHTPTPVFVIRVDFLAVRTAAEKWDSRGGRQLHQRASPSIMRFFWSHLKFVMIKLMSCSRNIFQDCITEKNLVENLWHDKLYPGIFFEILENERCFSTSSNHQNISSSQCSLTDCVFTLRGVVQDVAFCSRPCCDFDININICVHISELNQCFFILEALSFSFVI